MLVCNSCHRHYRPQDGSCPFCGTTLQTTTAAPSLGMTAALVLGLSMFGCNKGDDEGDEADSTESTEGTGTEGTEGNTEGTESSTTEIPDTGEADYGGPDSFDTETGFDTTDSTDDTGTADYGGPDTGTDTTDTGTSDSGTADYGGAPVPDPEFDI